VVGDDGRLFNAIEQVQDVLDRVGEVIMQDVGLGDEALVLARVLQTKGRGGHVQLDRATDHDGLGALEHAFLRLVA
jgi:hypothetical protein